MQSYLEACIFKFFFFFQALTAEVVKTIRDIISMNPLYRLVTMISIWASIWATVIIGFYRGMCVVRRQHLLQRTSPTKLLVGFEQTYQELSLYVPL